MSGYTYEKQNDGLMKDGDYEVTIEKIEKKILPSGKEKLSITYRVRSDVEQSYKNRCVFEDIWQEKENPHFFNRKRINQLLGTQEIEEGTSFGSIKDVINFLLGACLIVRVGTVFSDYHGEDINTVSYYKSSKFKPQKIVETSKSSSIVDEDELPF